MHLSREQVRDELVANYHEAVVAVYRRSKFRNKFLLRANHAYYCVVVSLGFQRHDQEAEVLEQPADVVCE